MLLKIELILKRVKLDHNDDKLSAMVDTLVVNDDKDDRVVVENS
jgi:hypothetical protein